MIIIILIEHMCSGHVGPGGLSFLILLETNYMACIQNASQFLILIFGSLTGFNVLTGMTER